MIKVLIVAPTHLAGEALARALSADPELEVLGTSTSAAEAVEQCVGACIALASMELPESGAMNVVRSLSGREGAHVLVMGLAEAPGVILEYLEAGAVGYVTRHESVEKLVECVRAVARGETILDSAIQRLVVDRLRCLSQLCADNDIDAARTSALTDREREILERLEAGDSNRQIAEHFGLEIGTVKNHVHSILAKLEVPSRADAALYYRLFKDRSET